MSTPLKTLFNQDRTKQVDIETHESGAFVLETWVEIDDYPYGGKCWSLASDKGSISFYETIEMAEDAAKIWLNSKYSS